MNSVLRHGTTNIDTHYFISEYQSRFSLKARLITYLLSAYCHALNAQKIRMNYTAGIL